MICAFSMSRSADKYGVRSLTLGHSAVVGELWKHPTKGGYTGYNKFTGVFVRHETMRGCRSMLEENIRETVKDMKIWRWQDAN